MPPWLTAKTLGLPRWGWGLLLAGGVVAGLYLRSQSASEEEEPPLEATTIGGNPVPPASPIEAGGSTGQYYSIPPTETKPAQYESEKPVEEQQPIPASEPELPESTPPPEQVSEQPANPGHGQIVTVPGHPGQHGSIGNQQVAAPPSTQQEHEKARNEINRLQAEIDGLQNHISQVTNAIQSHPNAKQRGQWESERNQDRANIDHKRSEVIWWDARL